MDPDILLVLCHDTEVSLNHVKKAAKNTGDKTVSVRIAAVYAGLGELLASQGHQGEAHAFYKKSVKWGGHVSESSRPTHPSRSTNIVSSIKSVLYAHPTADATIDKPVSPPSSRSPHKQPPCTATMSKIPNGIFRENLRPPIIAFNPPEPDARLNDTRQLAQCLGLLQSPIEADDILDSVARTWLQATKDEPDEIERLKTLATDVIRAFKRDEFKDAKAVTEVVYLAPILDKDDFRYLLKEFYSGIDQSGLLDVHQLEGLAHLIQRGDTGYLDTDDLVKVLDLLSIRLRNTHQQSINHLYQLTVAVSHVLDAMADANVSGLDRQKIHEPLSAYLDGLKGSSDAYLVYQAAYAYQALMCVPDDETLWQATLRRTGKVMQGVSGLVSAVKGLDLNGFIEGLGKIQAGMAGATEIVQVVKATYAIMPLSESGQGFFECLKEGLSFSRKCAWYTALRGTDILIRNGQFAEFRKLVCEAPCLRDAAFQWGVCQRLGEVAACSMWDSETRQNAIELLVEIYQNDALWGYQANVKQWIVTILMQLSSLPGGELHWSPSLLDRVQERPDVEGSLRQLRRQRLKERGRAVYIPPQAKASMQAHDESRFPLMEKVEEFLAGKQTVFLLMGDSGVGKSTFNRELECHLWQKYKKGGPIPLHINLPAIEKPEYDMITKHLRKAEFTETQIRELKLHRKFTLICDGYDESQQTHNLYTSNQLNQVGEWNAKMVISCRSEYLGADYRDRFQPVDRNSHSGPEMFQEAVITQFSLDQVQEYITQYVSAHRPPWGINEYREALDLIPSLKELVKNPFLMSLSLEVLPRMVDPGQDFSTTHITRTALYDQFIEHWLERGKKRLGEKNLSPQARSAFESLIDEGFTRNGIAYLKKLCTAIYKEQGGQPVVTYSRYKDESSWKAEFFSREEEKQILREACPLMRNGNQHRFIHRSLLEYGVALAIFDPQDWKEMQASESTLARRGSVSSILGFDGHATLEKAPVTIEQAFDLNSPLTWRRFVNESSVIQFLEERVQQEPQFKQQLLAYVEHSKNDRKWRVAAANAITILVRAGVQFNHADMRGIRVPYADLSYGMFDSALLQGADLRQVDFRGTWLRRANLDNAQMTGVQFGELPFLKHENEVSSCENSPDGETIAVRLSDGKVIMYSTSNWETQWTSEGYRGGTMSMAYSPNGKHIALGSNGIIQLWNVGTGMCIQTLVGHGGLVLSLAYSPQGDQIASSGDDMTIKVWDVESGECCHMWIGHTNHVSSLLYSPKGTKIVSSSGDRTIRTWDVATGNCLQVMKGHSSFINRIIYSPQGDQVTSVSDDRTLRLWDVDTGTCCHVLVGHSSYVMFANYSPNGRQLASASADKSVRIWDTDRGACLHVLQGHTGWVRCVIYFPQGDMVASASDDRTVRLWDVTTGVSQQTLIGHTNKVTNIMFLRKGSRIASTSHDTTVRLWDVGAGTSRHTSNGHSTAVLDVKCSSSGGNVATCSSDRTVRFWDVKTGVCRHVLRGHTSTVTSIDHSPHGDQIATGSTDNTIRLWSIDTGACIRILEGHTNWILTIAYSPQGDQLASGGYDKSVRLWDVKSGECRLTLKGHTSTVKGIVYSRNGNQLVSCSLDLRVRIWNVETGACKYTLSGHSDCVNRITYSPQDDQVASTSDDATVRVWDAGTGECRHIFIGHNTRVSSVAYSPSGDQISSCSDDGFVKVWDAKLGDCLWTFTGHSGWIYKIVYSPRGDLVVSASSDKSVRVWDVTSGQCRAMIQDFQDSVASIVWIESFGARYLVAGCADGMVGAWQVSVEDESCDVSLKWMTTKGVLDVKDATVQDVQGLSHLNRRLLKQRGTVGEPIQRLREASMNVTTMTSVLSKLKVPLSNTVIEDPNMKANGSLEQLGQLLERAKDPLIRDMMAFIVKNINERE
ncbi:MAG: WD40-repeat-containing domain protein [Benniella sp.]|nr:MAG: WD40-repeat-containing domain protein [Benniella sp.]